MAGHYDLTIDQGATLRRSFQWLDQDSEPIDITGCHLRARIFRDGTPNAELILTDQTGEFTIIDPLAGLFDLEIEDEVTDELLWPKGSWRMDALHPDGSVTPLREGAVTVRSRRGDTNGNGADETVIFMTAGIQGPPGPPPSDASLITEGTLPAAVMPALTGDVSTAVGTVATVIGAGKVTFPKIAPAAWSDDPTLVADSSVMLPTQHAVKNYVDNFATGLNWKQAVACASVGNLALTGEQLIDGVATGHSRVLVKNQTNPNENGIYLSAPTTWTRSTDADNGPELVSATVFVTAGTVNHDTQWTCTNDLITFRGEDETSPLSIGSSPINFAQVSGAGTYTAGAGLALSGNSFSIAAGGVTPTMLAPMSSAQLAGIMTDETGSGALVFATSPTLASATLTAPILTSALVNKWIFSAPTTAATLTAGGDNCTYTLPATSQTIPGLSQANIWSANGALSSGTGPAATFTGTWITGGSAITTKPYVLIEPTGTISNTWNTAGTALGVNAPSGFLGTLLDLQWNGVSKFSFSIPSSALTVGTVTLAGTAAGYLTLGGTGFDLRNISFASFTITNPTIQWPNNTPDVTLNRQGAGVVQIGTAVSNALGSLMCANIKAEPTNGTKIGTLTSEKLAFWGAVPVVQQVLPTGAAKTVDNVISFLQTIGLCKQA